MRYHPASGATLETLVTTLKGKRVRSTRFVSIGSGTSGTVTLPANSTVILNDFGGTVDAVVTQITSGSPNQISALTAAGAVVATTFDASGNWSFTGTPSAYPVAIVYRVYQTLENFDSTASDIVGVSEFHEIIPPASGGTGTSTVFTAGSIVFAGSSGVYAQDNSGIFYNDSTNSVGLGTASPAAHLHLAGNRSAATWGANGIGFRIADQTFTDTTSTGSPSLTIHNIGVPTIAATSSITPNNLTTLFVSAPVDGTNVVTATNRKYAIRTTGNCRFSGFNLYGSTSGNPVSVLCVDGNQTDTSWTTIGKMLAIQNATLTDSSGSGTISIRAISSYGVMTLAASNAETITNASNLYLDRAPTAGTNVTITNSNVIHIPGGSITGATNSYSLNIAAGTGATNNYAATFSGFVGMGGVTDPLHSLTVATSAAVLGTNEQIGLRSAREAITAGEMIGGISFRSNDTTLTAPGTVVGLFDMIATATHTASVLDSAFVWHTTSTLTMAERMRLDKDGQLGIGVTPTAKLHQDGGTTTATYHKFTNSVSSTTATDGFDVGIDAAAVAELRQREALDMIFYTNNTECFRLKSAGNVVLPTTVTAGGTTGNQTINKTTGTVNFAAAATAITVTNSLVATTSIVLAVVRTNDTTAVIKNVVPGAGSFVINLNAAATAETSVGFVVIN